MSAPGDAPDIVQQAADWYARLHRGPLTEVEAARLQEWLSEPAHREEFEKIDALWDHLEVLAQSPEIRSVRRELVATPPRVSRRAVLGWALAASVAGAGVYIGLPYLVPPDSYSTGIGEFRTVSLSDGSTVTLNTASEIRVRISRRARRIDLVRGQANFEVAKDPSRPFVVDVGDGEVVAVGTVFDVYRRASDVVVTLIEGRVNVRANAESLVLVPGEQVSFGVPGQAPLRSVADLGLVSAWRSGKLEFRETPLAEAIAEANRYSRVRIELRDPALANARISGVFDAGRNESLANALRAYFGLRIQRVGENRILLTSEPR